MGIYDQFFPASADDPRSRIEGLAGRPCYWLGKEWTPTSQQVARAVEEQRQQRAKGAPNWRRASGAEFAGARAAALAASEKQETIQSLLKEEELEKRAEFWRRDLSVSSDYYLIEFRHCRLVQQDGRSPVGLRFLAPNDSKGAPKRIDGSELDWATLIGDALKRIYEDDGLAISYMRFIFEHYEFGGEQSYVISDEEDFISHPEKIDMVPALAAQMRIRTSTEYSSTAREALGLPAAAIVPPMVLRRAASKAAVVFATVIRSNQLKHVCLEVSASGVRQLSARTLMPAGLDLPLVPLRSFSQQRAALKRARRL